MSERKRELVGTLEQILRLPDGESWVLREPGIRPCVVHRYPGCWLVLGQATDRHVIDRAVLGFEFRCPQDLVNFFLGALPHRNRFLIEGDRA